MATIKYHASGHFDIDTEIEVSEDASVLDIMMAIYRDLEDCYGLEVEILKGETDGTISTG